MRVDYPGINHLCEVSVTKEGESREVKWYADVESTFCSEKIDELIGKYVNQWNFSCDEWPDHDGIDDLSPRQRKFLDDIVRQNRNTRHDQEEYTLLGTRALTNSIALPGATEPNSLLAVQLFLGLVRNDSQNRASDSDTTQTGGGQLSVANRLIFVTDDGENQELLATLDDLNAVINLEEQGYTLDSVIIDSLHPNGELNVTTLVAAPDDDPDAIPSCFGHQKFQTSATGLKSLGDHQMVCDDASSAEPIKAAELPAR